MQIVAQPFWIIRANLRPYLAMNAIVYGLFIVGLGAGLLFPDLIAAQSGTPRTRVTESIVSAAVTNFWLFGLVILLINVFAASLLVIVLPSLIVPFAGIALFAFQALYFGVVLAPVDSTKALILIPHSLTLLIEFQAYALVMLGVFRVGRCWLRPTAIGAQTRRQGYVRGLRQLGWLGLPALALLIIGAFYESFEVLHLVPALISG